MVCALAVIGIKAIMQKIAANVTSILFFGCKILFIGCVFKNWSPKGTINNAMSSRRDVFFLMTGAEGYIRRIM